MGFFFQLGELELALGFGDSTLKKCLPQVRWRLSISLTSAISVGNQLLS
jgi:hypothetical protein